MPSLPTGGGGRYPDDVRRSVSLILLVAALLLAVHHTASVDGASSDPVHHGGGAMPALLAGACVGILILATRMVRWLGYVVRRSIRERFRRIRTAFPMVAEQPRHPPPRSLAVLCVLQR